jgi:hypothetical protein
MGIATPPSWTDGDGVGVGSGVDGSAPSLASARFTIATVSCWLGEEAIP